MTDCFAAAFISSLMIFFWTGFWVHYAFEIGKTAQTIRIERGLQRMVDSGLVKIIHGDTNTHFRVEALMHSAHQKGGEE